MQPLPLTPSKPGHAPSLLESLFFACAAPGVIKHGINMPLLPFYTYCFAVTLQHAWVDDDGDMVMIHIP